RACDLCAGSGGRMGGASDPLNRLLRSGDRGVVQLDVTIDDLLFHILEGIHEVGVVHHCAFAVRGIVGQADNIHAAFGQAVGGDGVRTAVEDVTDLVDHEGVNELQCAVSDIAFGIRALVDIHTVGGEAFLLDRKSVG